MSIDIKPLEHELTSERVIEAYNTFCEYCLRHMDDINRERFYKYEANIKPMKDLGSSFSESELYEAYVKPCVQFGVQEVMHDPQDVRSEMFDDSDLVRQYPFMVKLKNRIMEEAEDIDRLVHQCNPMVAKMPVSITIYDETFGPEQILHFYWDNECVQHLRKRRRADNIRKSAIIGLLIILTAFLIGIICKVFSKMMR